MAKSIFEFSLPKRIWRAIPLESLSELLFRLRFLCGYPPVLLMLMLWIWRTGRS